MNKTVGKLLLVLKKRQMEQTILKEHLEYVGVQFRHGQWKVNTVNIAKILGEVCFRLSQMIEIDMELEQVVRGLLVERKEE